MCDCLDKVTDQMIKHVVDKNEGGVLQGHIVQKQFSINNRKIDAPTTYCDFEYTIVPIKKDGAEGKRKRKIIKVAHAYCPFCGQKHKLD